MEGNKNSVNSKACYECYTDIPNQDKLLRHLASKHGKLNNLLDEHGFKRVEVEDCESSDEEQDVRVILILKISFLQLLHGFKLFHLVSNFQNSFCF